MKEQLTTDVLIIGGGPAGMLSAIYLDLLGVSSIVLERKAEISQHPKAHELSARSIEILQQLGFSLEDLASPEPYLNLSQTELEKLMRKRLKNCSGAELFLSHQWESWEEKEGEVVSKVKRLSDGEEMII